MQICNLLLIIVVGGDLADVLGGSQAPAMPMSHQAQDPVVQMSSTSYAPSYGIKPPV